MGTNRYLRSEGILFYELREQWRKRGGKPTSCWDEGKGECLIWALAGCCALSHWCQWAPGTRGESGRGFNRSGRWSLSLEEIWSQNLGIFGTNNTHKLLSPHPMVSSQICCCAYRSCILAFISVTTLEIPVPWPGFSGFSFLAHVHVSFSHKTSLPCPGYSRNMDKSCQGLNTAVLGWGKKGEFRLNLVKGENNLWFWGKHPSFG